MAIIDSGLTTLMTNTINANRVKNLVLEQLCADGVLTRGQECFYSENWQVITIQPSWFERWCEKFLKGPEEVAAWKFKFVQFEPKSKSEKKQSF